jgi:uncharacterized protein (TIGR02246 family)
MVFDLMMTQKHLIPGLSKPLQVGSIVFHAAVPLLALALNASAVRAVEEIPQAANQSLASSSSSASPSPPSSGVTTEPHKSDEANGSDEAKIRGLLQKQADDWNKGDLEQFVEGYRKSDDTLFVGATGIKRGSKAILERYKLAYPDKEAMGHLTFSNLEVHVTCATSAYAVGEFKLDLAKKEPKSGFFSLNLLKSDGRWEIVADHTTAK